MDRDNNDNDEGIVWRMPLLAISRLHMPTMHPILDVHLVPNLDVAIASFSDPITLSSARVDKFYNAIGKVPHFVAIISKKEEGLWMNRKVRK